MRENQKVIVLTGAAGTGKTTIQNYLKQNYDIPQIITHTTRPARLGEQTGIDYYFETPTSFSKLHLLENVTYAGNRYGSSWEAIDRALTDHQLASIVLDTEGAITYQAKLGQQAIIIFVEVADQNELKVRMLNRGDDVSAVEKRMQSEETQRDFKLPAELQKAVVLKNENWTATKRQIEQIMKNLKDD